MMIYLSIGLLFMYLIWLLLTLLLWWEYEKMKPSNIWTKKHGMNRVPCLLKKFSVKSVLRIPTRSVREKPPIPTFRKVGDTLVYIH